MLLDEATLYDSPHYWKFVSGPGAKASNTKMLVYEVYMHLICSFKQNGVDS
jgi:hypothetical protein